MNILEQFRLGNKVALVTGGGRGIGQSIAEALAEAGAQVVIVSRKLDNCQRVAGAIKKSGGNASAIRCNLELDGDIAALIVESQKRFGKIDILVNNSGMGWISPTLDFPIEQWDRVLKVNVRGPWLLTQKVARMMKEQGGGKIIFISSIWGLRGIAEFIQPTIAYNVSKGAIHILVKDLAVKLAPFNITVNAIAPGLFVSDMSSSFDLENKASIKKILVNSIPLGRMGVSADIKGLSVFLSSPTSDYLTGTIIPLDGGATATYMPSKL